MGLAIRKLGRLVLVLLECLTFHGAPFPTAGIPLGAVIFCRSIWAAYLWLIEVLAYEANLSKMKGGSPSAQCLACYSVGSVLRCKCI